MKVNNFRGFTLMEVMMAMAIFAIGILGVAKLQTTATSQTTNSRVLMEEATLATRELEKLLNYSYENLTTSQIDENTEAGILSDKITSSSGAHSGATYNVSRTINPHTPIKDITQIIVTLDRQGTNQNFTVTTYKREPE